MFKQIHAEEKKELSDYRISGNAQLVSHFIEKGLSYSDSNPAMNASFLMNLGSQVRIGLWGSNVSNLSAADDNLWLKIMAEISFEFSEKSSGKFFVSDDHFYKSNQRNGQVAGFTFKYNSYEFELHWLGNYEGTKSGAEYFRFGKLFNFKKDFNYGGYLGYTNSHTSTLDSYLDAKIVAQYLFTSASSFEAGATYNSNNTQFGKRGDPAYYIGVLLSY